MSAVCCCTDESLLKMVMIFTSLDLFLIDALPHFHRWPYFKQLTKFYYIENLLKIKIYLVTKQIYSIWNRNKLNSTAQNLCQQCHPNIYRYTRLKMQWGPTYIYVSLENQQVQCMSNGGNWRKRKIGIVCKQNLILWLSAYVWLHFVQIHV